MNTGKGCADGKRIPRLGLGTWKLPTDVAEEVVTEAVNRGYRHVDCAPVYNNERQIGRALHRLLHSGKVGRDEIWITSKLWCNAHAPKHVRPALERTLLDLQLDYLDLYLIHWPVSFRADIAFPKRADQFISEQDLPLAETWHALENMVERGLCRSIGVSNCNRRRLQTLQSQCRIQPAVLQIELHPYLQQWQLLDYCEKNAITLVAYSPLGSGIIPASQAPAQPLPLLQHPVIEEIAVRHRVSPAQVLIAWGLQRQTVLIPKAADPGHLRENFQSQDLRLDSAAMEALRGLDIGHRYLDGRFFAPPGSPYSVEDLWA